MKRKLLIGIIVFALIAWFVGYKIMYKQHREIASEDVAFSTSAQEIHQDYIDDPDVANSKYADKTIVVSGKLTSYDQAANTIVVDSILSAVLQAAPTEALQNGSSIQIKGRFVGYDDLLEELKMDQVSILKSN